VFWLVDLKNGGHWRLNICILIIRSCLNLKIEVKRASGSGWLWVFELSCYGLWAYVLNLKMEVMFFIIFVYWLCI
jgi:hypothetical protein